MKEWGNRRKVVYGKIEGRYRWPRNQLEVKTLTWKQFDWLMSGLDIEQPKDIGSTSNVNNLSA